MRLTDIGFEDERWM